MRDSPLVSIIVPSFNQGRFIRETIDSCLSQDWRPLEVLVMDGASTDETVDVLRSYGDIPELRWRSEPDRGVVDAVNKGLREAKGEILAIQSSDDAFCPGAVGSAVEALLADSSLGFVCGDVEYVDEDSRVTGRTVLPPFSIRAFLEKSTYVPQPSTFFRATAAREAGLWDEAIPYAADAEYWLRLAIAHPARKVDALWARYRYHGHQRDKAGTRPARDWEWGVRRLISSGRVPPELRRSAECGIWLTWHHYSPESEWRQRTAYLYRAAIAQPSAVGQAWFPKRELLPGREPLWKRLSLMKRRLGALLFERPRFAWPLFVPGLARGRWLGFRNRSEALAPGPGGKGVDCRWRWTSDLNVARVFPGVSRRLLGAALGDHPIAFEEKPPRCDDEPVVSFVIGHRGRARLPHLRATLRTIAAQKGVPVEAIVVEQDETPSLTSELPDWVRVVPCASRAGEPFARAWAFNVGARQARGRILVCHDGDILAPEDYAAEVAALVESGNDAVRALRFLFYLDQASTELAVGQPPRLGGLCPRKVTQNAVGGTVAVTREAYEAIGGHDESFVGWGGEDNEFFDRLERTRLWRWGFLPFVHLEHPSQPASGRNGQSRSLLERRLAVPAEERIRRLRSLPWGSSVGPIVERA